MSDQLEKLRTRIDGLMPVDRHRLTRTLERVARAPGRGGAAVREIEIQISDAEQRYRRRQGRLPRRLAYPAELPITDKRDELLDTIRDHQVVIVAGETGSGKSTQLPKLCLELGRGIDGYIGHTQPRRIAARSIASRVAEELGSEVGGTVGYAVRFSDQVRDDTLVKVMTDGLLLAEVHHDRRLLAYDTIIIDEAHERSLNIDFLLGFLASLLPKRPDLKLIITSATIDTERFSRHFDDAPVVEVSGRNYPVEVRYRPLADPELPEPRDQPQGICDAVEELLTEGPGDILVFCSGEREIRDAARALTDMHLPHTEILPLYARLPVSEQQRVFRPHTGRRIVLATNVAETSLTVPGIRYVVDPGTARISRFNRRTKVQRLPIEPISRASADQRAGRCGRLGPGVCIRLYDRADFESRPEFTEPEIQRTNLAAVILQMATLGLGDIESFPFLDPPDRRTIHDGIALLEELGAIRQQDPDRRPTGLGRRLARLPVDLRLGRMILEADRNGCLREALIIAAGLAIQDPRERPEEHQQHADQLHARFADPASDFLSWLHLWEYLHDEKRIRTSSGFRRMCREEFLSYRRVREWQDVHAQLREVAAELGMRRNAQPADPDSIHRSLLAGLLSHVGTRDPDGWEYRGARGSRFAINPGSVLFKKGPQWVMAAELVETTRLWARGVAAIDPDWAEAAGSHLVKRSHSDPWWDRERGAAVAHETVTLYGLPLHTDRTVLLGRVDRRAAREMFILNALVAGDWDTDHEFMRRNRETIQEVLGLEARFRRTDLLTDDRRAFEFFDARLPEDITSVRHFDAWWRRTRDDQPDLLDLSLEELVDPTAESLDEEDFPRVWQYGDVEIPLGYEFDPTSPTDGVTIAVPISSLERIDPAVFDWHVPGLREEMVVAMIRTLPKRLRKRLTPIPETARRLLAEGTPAGVGPITHLRRELSRMLGEPLPVGAFDVDQLPPHLRPRFQILTDEGAVLADGSDLAELKQMLTAEARAAATAARHPLEVDGLTSWSIGELPESVEIEGPGHAVTAYPALVDDGDSVSVRLLATAAEQAYETWRGTRRFLVLNLPPARKLLDPLLTDDARIVLAAGPYDEPDDWSADTLNAALDRLLTRHGGSPRNAVEFDALLDHARNELYDELTLVADGSLRVLWTLRNLEPRLQESTRRFPEAVTDMRSQIKRFVYPGFVTGLGADRLEDAHRYLRAIERRLDRLPDNTQRDRELMERVGALEAEHDRMQDLLPASSLMVDVAWMLQELRVSFFAQSLGTRGKVSEKRIRAALDDLAAG